MVAPAWPSRRSRRPPLRAASPRAIESPSPPPSPGGPGRLRAVEPLEDQGLMLRRYARSIVRDQELRPTAGTVDGLVRIKSLEQVDREVHSRLGVGDGVVEEVAHDAATSSELAYAGAAETADVLISTLPVVRARPAASRTTCRDPSARARRSGQRLWTRPSGGRRPGVPCQRWH
jgi:hypothetical protein